MAKFLAVVLVLACLVAMTSGCWCVGFGGSKKYEQVLGGMTNGEIFRALDKNQDNFLTLDDWNSDGGQENDFEQMVDYADKNNDGKISFAEFKTIKNLKIKL